MGHSVIRMVAMALVLGAGVTALNLAVARAGHDARHPGLCGPERQFMCGEILVILADESVMIDDVLNRHIEDAPARVLYEFQAVRDLLAGDRATDLTAATVYALEVPVGEEVRFAEVYKADAGVYAAAVNRETIGSLTPNTAMSAPERPLIVAGFFVLGWGLISAYRVRGRRLGVKHYAR